MSDKSTDSTPKPALNTSKIDQMIAEAAKRREHTDAAGAAATEEAQRLQREAKEAREKAKKAREAAKTERDQKKAQDKEARAKRRTERQAESAAKKLKRDQERAARQAKRAKKGPPLDGEALSLHEQATKSLAPNDLMNLADALSTAAKAALGRASTSMQDRAEPGDTVRVLSGPFAGRDGVVKQAAPRRARVAIGDREAYLFTAQLEVTSPE